MAVFESFSLALRLKTQPSPQYIFACNYGSVDYGLVMLYDTDPDVFTTKCPKLVKNRPNLWKTTRTVNTA